MELGYISYEEMYDSATNDNLDIKFSSKSVVKNAVILKDDVNENYNFVNKNIFFRIASFIFYCFVFILLYPAMTLFYFPRVKGKKNLKGVKNAVFICNHTFMVDCAVLSTHVLKFRRPYILVNKSNLQIPVVKTIIRLLKAVPLPNGLIAYKKLLKSIDEELKNNKQNLLVYPEGSMWPYYSNIRPLNSGAFRFSVKNDLPVVPIVISFRKPCKLYRIFGRKRPFLNVNILEPTYPNASLTTKEQENDLNEKCYLNMKKVFKENNTYSFINEKALSKNKNN